MEISTKKILLAGDGWGFDALFLGMKDKFTNIFLLTNDLSYKKCNNLVEDINSNQFDLIICSGYKPIIKKELLNKFTLINIHYSILPKYRGMHPVVWAILNDETEIGLTIFLMNEFIDDGDILYQYRIENKKNMTSSDFMVHLNNHIRDNISKIINKYFKGEIEPIKQKKAEATWVGKRNIDDCELNFNYSHKQIINLFRALVSPYPLPHIKYKGKIYEICKYALHYSNCSTHLGRVLNIDNDGVWIKTKDGYIIVSELMSDNQKIKAKDIFKKIGIRLK